MTTDGSIYVSRNFRSANVNGYLGDTFSHLAWAAKQTAALR